MEPTVYHSFFEARKNNRKKFAVLIDPDKVSSDSILSTVELAVKAEVDYLFLGGSLLVNDTLDVCLDIIKSSCDIPVILFPGSTMQVNAKADAVFYSHLSQAEILNCLLGNM